MPSIEYDQIIEYKGPSGISVVFHLSTELLKFHVSNDIWLSVARQILKIVDKLFFGPVKDLIVHVIEFRDALIIEGEKSKARIQAGKLIAVTKIYEQKKKEVESFPGLSDEAKQKLISRLDRALDIQIERIIEYPA